MRNKYNINYFNFYNMRFKTLFMSMCVGMALVGCSSDDAAVDNGNKGSIGETQYLTVNLVTNSTNGTRAAGDQTTGKPNDATYEEGLEAENAVNKVRFYFFDSNGNPAAVRNTANGFANYLDWEKNISVEGPDMPNVEKVLSATLVLQSPLGDDTDTPTQIVAIVNPEEDADETLSLTSLADIAGNYGVIKDANGFVMSNSTYMNGGAKQMTASVDGKIKTTSGEALNDPVQIYVERTMAKVRLNSGLTPKEVNGVKIYPTSANGKRQTITVTVTEDGETKSVEKEIFVKFLGWNTTAVADKSRLIKEINTTWEPNLLGDNMPWNWSDFSRSFWAVNAADVKYQYGAFQASTGEVVDDNLFQAQAKTKFDKSEWVYINENATDVTNISTGADPATPTKVIIAAQLVDEDGNALEIAEYGETRTTVAELKKLYANNCGLYRKTTTGEGENVTTTFTKITPDDIVFKTISAVDETDGKPNPAHKGRYKVYAQLKDGVDKDDYWYPSNSKDAKAMTAADANASLHALGTAKVWSNGMTYYFFDIKHLGNIKSGVVRNHIYDANITALTGLGTPVYNPDEIIYPEKPEDDENTYIAAQISILSWRVVSNDVELNW